VDTTALVTAIIGTVMGAAVARDLMRGRRWSAAGGAAMGGAALLNLVTMGNRSWLEHQVVFVVGIALLIGSMAAFGAARREKQHDVGGFLR
jgi:hypothetical protein